MASASTRHLLLVAVVLAVSHSVQATAPVTVGEACKLYTKHASYCTDALAKAPGIPPVPVPLPVLAELALTQAAASGAAALAFIKRMEMLAGGMPLGCLDKCVGKFQTAVAALQKSRAAIVEHRDVARVKRWVRAARADGETCMDGCHMVEGGADPTIMRRITDLGKLCSVALALADAAATHN